MKLLRITAEGLRLFKEKLDLNFYAQQRVEEEHTRDILGDSKEVRLNTYFFSRKTNEVCRLETIITARKSKSEGACSYC